MRAPTVSTLALALQLLLTASPLLAATPAEQAAEQGGVEVQRGNFSRAHELLTEALSGELPNEDRFFYDNPATTF